MARGALLAMDDEVTVSDIFLDELPPVEPRTTVITEARDNEITTLREMEKGLIYKALDKTEGNRTHAAKILGISVRTLRNKLAEYKEMVLETGQAA